MGIVSSIELFCNTRHWEMLERGLLFLFSLGVIIASLAAAVWLVTTGQAAYVDGLFLLLTCLVAALAFSLYLRYLIRSAIKADAPVKAAAKTVAGGPKKAAAPAPAKTEPVTASRSS